MPFAKIYEDVSPAELWIGQAVNAVTDWAFAGSELDGYARLAISVPSLTVGLLLPLAVVAVALRARARAARAPMPGSTPLSQEPPCSPSAAASEKASSSPPPPARSS